MAQLDIFIKGEYSRGSEYVTHCFNELREQLDIDGNVSIFGVTLDHYAAYRRMQGYIKTTEADFRNITFKAWRAIFKSRFWDAWLADLINDQPLAEYLVVKLVSGKTEIISQVQSILGLEQTGKVTGDLIKHINSEDPKALIATLRRDSNRKQ